MLGSLFGGDNTPNYGAMALKSEKRRQGVIDLGLQQINAVYGGGNAPFYSLANTGREKFDSKKTYYQQNRKGEFVPYWAPKGARPSGTTSISGAGVPLTAPDPFLPGKPFVAKALGLDKLFGKSESPRDIARKAYRRGQLLTGPQYESFEGFQEPFFQKRAQDYVNFALPQLADQYQATRNQMNFGLENRGLTNSSVASQAAGNLEKTTGQARQTIADSGINQANQLKEKVEQSRQQMINQLYQSADPAQAMQASIAAASGFQAPSTFAPLANMFSNIANQYYTSQLLNNYRLGAGNNDTNYSLPIAPIPN